LKEEHKILEDQISKNRQEIKTDRMDMSFGEILNMYEDGEIVISPEYQRAFRWDVSHQTKFIESIILGIPFPPIFVAEDKDNVWELVDGLQRISTILSFFGKLKDESKNNLVLEEGGIVKELNNVSIKTLPLKIKLLLKRAVCRVEIIRVDSGFDMKYELFKRLNTGGLTLTPQEIRNCVFRSDDNKFNGFINELASNSIFRKVIKISDIDKEKMQYEELVLRYLSLKNKKTRFGQNIQDHFDKYMREVVKGDTKVDYNAERKLFLEVVTLLKGSKVNLFKMSRRNFSTSVFDSVMLSLATDTEYFKTKGIGFISEKISELIKSPEFKQNAGSASSSQTKINTKLKIAKQTFGLEK
jgi:uncharacterized protein with ParB-like and HNH nuclease domain